jgi:hypothetical protein
MSDGRRAAGFLLMSDFERLEEWCRNVVIAFGGGVPYLVGSALATKDYRDVDLRMLCDDATFDANYRADPVRVRIVNRMVSIWGQQETGLPIDFQVQRATEANAEFPGPRNPMGLRDWRTIPTSGVPKSDAASPAPREEPTE